MVSVALSQCEKHVLNNVQSLEQLLFLAGQSEGS